MQKRSENKTDKGRRESKRVGLSKENFKTLMVSALKSTIQSCQENFSKQEYRDPFLGDSLTIVRNSGTCYIGNVSMERPSFATIARIQLESITKYLL